MSCREPVVSVSCDGAIGAAAKASAAVFGRSYYHPSGAAQIWLFTLYDKGEVTRLSPSGEATVEGGTRCGARSACRTTPVSEKVNNGNPKATCGPKKRSLFGELMSGVEAMRDHREGRLTLKTQDVSPITVPPVDADVVRETREALKMSRHVFAFKIGVNPRTLERWEQGRSKPNEQAAALIWLVRKYRHA